MTDSGLPRR